jgi:dihydroxyacetone kinase
MKTHEQVTDAPTETTVVDAMHGIAKNTRRSRNSQLSIALVNASAVISNAASRHDILDVSSTMDKARTVVLAINGLGAVALSVMAIGSHRMANRLDTTADYYAERPAIDAPDQIEAQAQLPTDTNNPLL